MTIRSLALAGGVLLAAVSLASAQTPASAAKVLVNTDRQGVALQGYDPVGFFADSAAVKGRPDLTVRYRGATYRFATPEHLAAFEREPARYEPQFGGYCAYGVSRGYPAPVKIDTWQIVEGRLLLNYDRGVRRKFDEDRAGNLRKADANWPAIVEEKGKVPSEE